MEELNCGYLSSYRPKGLALQTMILRKLFSITGTAREEIAEGPLPAGAEGWFAIPRWELVAATYNDAVLAVLELIRGECGGKFRNWREGHLGPQYLRQTKRTVRFWEKLSVPEKGHDVLVVPARFGFHRWDLLVRQDRAVINPLEFELDTFAVGVVLLTHPECLKYYDDLWVYSGDEYSHHADNQFSITPVFIFDNGEVEFSAYWVGHAGDVRCSPSGFLPAETR